MEPTNKPLSKKQQHILDVATRLFIEKGYKGMSMDLLAKEAQVSKPTLYTRYQGKADLFVAVVRSYKEKQQVVFPSFLDEEVMPYEENLRQFIRTTFEYFLNDAVVNLVRLIISESLEFPMLSKLYFTDKRGKISITLGEYLENLVAMGKIQLTKESAELSVQVVAAIREQSLWARLMHPPHRQIPTSEALTESVWSLLNAFIRSIE